MEKYITQLTESEKDELLKDSELAIGYRGIGHCGYSISIIKSALQKGVRRNEHHLVRWSLRETFLYYCMRNRFSHLNSAALAFNTNIINRLHIIAVEDCSPRALVAVNECVANLRRYKELGDSGPQYLMKAGMCLCDCPSSRVCSHLRALCGGGGPYHIAFDAYERKNGGKISIDERLRVIFDVHLMRGEEKNDNVSELRAISAYHSLKVYHQLSDRDDYGNLYQTCKPTTAAVKKIRFFKFWQKCFDAIQFLSINDKFVEGYKEKLENAIRWRMEFFCSKNYFREESLLLLSAVDLLIAIVHGPKDEFTSIQTLEEFKEEDSKKFNWLTDHRTIDPMPRYVRDQHTSSPDASVSFAMESSRVIGGDERWSPVFWLYAYTALRVRANEFVSSEDQALHISAKAHIQLEIDKIIEKLDNSRLVALPTTSLITNFFQSTKRPLFLKNDAIKRRKYAHDCVKDVESLPELKFEDIELVIAVHNSNSRKAPVASVRMVDKSVIVIKLMKKIFGYGVHQNFVQNLKDENVCDFKYLHPMPESGNYRGLMKGRFEIVKSEAAAPRVVKISQSKVYFVTGCVTQKGNVVDTRLSHNNNLRRDTFSSVQMVHIIAFRLLMGVNDTNHSNVLVGENAKLYSVDENYVGSKSHKEFLDTKGCRYLKTFLRISKNEALLHLPSWMSNESQRRQMLSAVRVRGRKDGISEETLDEIDANSIDIREKLIHFLFENGRYS